MSLGHMQEYALSALSRYSQGSYLSYVYVSLTLISAIFQEVLAVLKQVKNREKGGQAKKGSRERIHRTKEIVTFIRVLVLTGSPQFRAAVDHTSEKSQDGSRASPRAEICSSFIVMCHYLVV